MLSIGVERRKMKVEGMRSFYGDNPVNLNVHVLVHVY
jgi:hypothetical protein